ncbi:ATP-binding protein [Limnohabitans sp. DCL3]|uniref:ATP-binding protein n=1 Tax=Limnohabitans sp. DCL3 TaxID=3374103 RepID=UPI003A8BE551
MNVQNKGGWQRGFEWVVARLPAPYREGKMPYVVFFVTKAIALLLVYSALNTYQNSTPWLLMLAAWLALLLLLVNHGLSLSWGVHLGTVAGAFVLTYAAWHVGGVFSPRLTWLLVLPLTPFYVISRRAGMAWLLIVWLIQLGMALANHHGLVPVFETGPEHALSSWVTFSLVTGMLIVVPLIYDRLHVMTLQKSLRYQEALEAKRQELELTLQTREHFIATVSHELRTPMNAILGFNALLLSQVEGKPEALKVLNHTRQSADHLMTVINDILDYSQLQAGKLVVQPETFELRRVADHAFELFKPRVNSMELDYRIELDEHLPGWVHTDRHRLMQVLVNLLGNALKFTHQGSVVLRVQWLNPGVQFTVQDTGIGIPHARQLNIFKRFSQAEDDTQARYGGNGLGLAISQKLAHLLGGEIGFESEPGKGSRFWLHLPLSAAAAPPKAFEKHPHMLQSAHRAWTFLVADDHPVNRLLLKQVLKNAWPHSVVLQAVDGQQTLDVLREQDVDLVFMDMVMPVMDGIDATGFIRQDELARIRQVPVFGLTANVNPLDLERFKAAGLSDVMLKPFEPAELCQRVESWLLAGHEAI